MRRLLFALVLCTSWADAQTTVTVTGDGAATVVTAGTQGPAGASVPSGGSAGLVPAYSGGGYAWSDLRVTPGSWASVSLPAFRVYIPNQDAFIGTLFIGTGGTTISSTETLEGDLNTVIGINAGDYLTTGYLNTFVGQRAGRVASTTHESTLVGASAGLHVTTGHSLTCLGSGTCQETTTGHTNVMIGSDAGLLNTEGWENVFIGSGAGGRNTTGYGNVFIGGRYTGDSNTTGYGNTGIGEWTLNLGNGNKNTALGYAAGRYETGSSKLFIDGFSRDSEANGRAKSIIYGEMAAEPKDQRLFLNAEVALTPIIFAELGTPVNGTIAYCSDCAKATPCAGSGNGAFAKRLNGAWDCD